MNQENESNNPYLEIKIDVDSDSAPSESESPVPDENLGLEIIPEDTINKDEADENESDISKSLEEIKQQIKSVSLDFESKIKYDEHKNKVIDELHQALQDYRQGILQKYVQRIFTDVLKVVDDIRKFTAHYNNKQHADEVTDKILKFLETTASDLEDLFSWEGIAPYNCENDLLDPTRQRVVNKINTDDATKDKTIAERIRPGYEWDGKVIRPEMVSVFVYQNNDTPEDEETDDQTG